MVAVIVVSVARPCSGLIDLQCYPDMLDTIFDCVTAQHRYFRVYQAAMGAALLTNPLVGNHGGRRAGGKPW